jgi:hypothetical protein
MTPEDEEFNRIEMESRIKQDYVRDIKQPSREQLMAEVAVLTEMVRVLYDRLAKLEKPWVGLTDEDRYEFAAAQYGWEELLIAAEAKLKEKNT